MRRKKKNPWDIDWQLNKLGIDPNLLTNDDRMEAARLFARIQDIPEQERKVALLEFIESQHQRQIELSLMLRRSPEGQYHSMRSVMLRGVLLALLSIIGTVIFFAIRDGSGTTLLVTSIVLALFFLICRANGVRIWQYCCISFLPNIYARRFIKLLRS